MELPAEVLVHNQLVGMKGNKGRLLDISSNGYYELNCAFGDSEHRVLLPIHETVLIAQEAEQSFSTVNVER